jgi:hypothetical protein
MAFRAEKVGGTLAFRRARLGGVRIEVRIPLPVRMEPAYPQLDVKHIEETTQ